MSISMSPEFSPSEAGLILSAIHIYTLLGGQETVMPEYAQNLEKIQTGFRSTSSFSLSIFELLFLAKVVGLFHGLVACGQAQLHDSEGQDIRETALVHLRDIYERLMTFVRQEQQDAETDLQAWKAVAEQIYRHQSVPLRA